MRIRNTGLFIVFIQYYSVICRPSVHTVGRPQAEIRTRDGQSRGTLKGLFHEIKKSLICYYCFNANMMKDEET